MPVAERGGCDDGVIKRPVAYSLGFCLKFVLATILILFNFFDYKSPIR